MAGAGQLGGSGPAPAEFGCRLFGLAVRLICTPMGSWKQFAIMRSMVRHYYATSHRGR